MKSPAQKKRGWFAPALARARWKINRAGIRFLLRLAAAAAPGFGEEAMILVGRYEPEALRSFIADRASDLAVGVTMVMLDRERITHCHVCPQRFGLKRLVGGRYACLKHCHEEEKAPKPA